MNSMPAASIAPLMATSEDDRLGGTPSYASKRFTVWMPTPAAVATWAAVHLSAARAHLICNPVII